MSSDAKDAKRLSRLGSDVECLDSNGQLYKGLYVWCDCAPAVKADPELMFAKCLVLQGSTRELLKLRQVDPEDSGTDIFDAKQPNVYNLNHNIDPMAYPDIGMIPHTNVAAVVDFIRQRYVKGQIYVTADPLLLAVNPFKDLGNATGQIINQYRDAMDPSRLPPHVFSIGRLALENLHSVKKSQTIIVSGESGAGKTEATKQIMRYFAACKSGTVDLRIQTAVLAGNPVLEALGNAKTVRNNNSSRFGRFMQLQVAAVGGIEFGYVKNFLLEMSRIIGQESQERNYHIFYQVLKGLSTEEKKKYQIGDNYKCVNMITADGIDDVKDMAEVKQSLLSMGMNAAEMEQIFRTISAVMMLSNISISAENRGGIPDAAKIDQPVLLQEVCQLLQIDLAKTLSALLIKVTQASGQEIKGIYSSGDTLILKESMAKAVYNSLFNWIVRKLNTNIQPPSGFDRFLGMLDIFGFEVFKNNSLEQLFINITNEMLQKNFVDVVFDRETKLYRSEGISSAELTWTTNAPIIDLLTNKKKSVIAQLEDTCLAPGGDDKKFLSATADTLSSHPNFSKAKISSDINFIVTHTIGDIQYCATGFLAKNKDLLKSDLVEVLQSSENHVTAGLFENVKVEKGKIGKDQLISAQFLMQLHTLMELINSTEPHFVRCLKPNEEKAALKFTTSKVLIQLHALSILEALQLRNLGYSYRRPFSEFLTQFQFLDLGISEDKTLEPKNAAEMMLAGSQLPKHDFQIGHTMVFLKQEAVKFLTIRQRELMAAWGPLISILEALYKRFTVKQQITRYTPSLVRVQAHIRA